MKKLNVLLALTIAAFLTGCMSPGGLVIGPVSSYTASRNERALIKRAALSSTDLTVDQKKRIVVATATGNDAGEIALMVGVDLLQLRGAKLTKQEVGKQVLSALGDAIIYGVAAYAADKSGLINLSSEDSNSRNIAVNISGSEGTSVNISGDSDVDTQTDNHSDNRTTAAE